MSCRLGIACITCMVLILAAAGGCLACGEDSWHELCVGASPVPCTRWLGPTPSEVLHRELWRMEVLLTRARHQLDADKVEDALYTCLTGKRIGLWEARLESLLGEVYVRQENWTAAAIALRRSTHGEPDRLNLAEALTGAGWERHNWGMRADAVRLWREAVANAPMDWWAQTSLGLGYLHAGDWRLAEAHCRRAAEADAQAAGAQVNLGLVLYVKRELAEAEKRTREALALQPRFPLAMSNLAFIMFDLGEVEEALSLWQRSLELDGSRADAWAGLGIGRLRSGRRGEAIDAYRKAAARDKTYRSAEKLVSQHFWSADAAETAAELIEALAE